MGTAGGPKLVTKGLALALDTASPKSYPGSGDVLFDLSGNLNGELYGSPSFTSNNHGTFDFDGSNDYVNTNKTAKEKPVLTKLLIDSILYK